MNNQKLLQNIEMKDDLSKQTCITVREFFNMSVSKTCEKKSKLSSRCVGHEILQNDQFGLISKITSFQIWPVSKCR